MYPFDPLLNSNGEFQVVPEIRRTKIFQLQHASLYRKQTQAFGVYPLLKNWKSFVNISSEHGEPCKEAEFLQLIMYRLRETKIYVEEIQSPHKRISDYQDHLISWLERLTTNGYNCPLAIWLNERGLTAYKTRFDYRGPVEPPYIPVAGENVMLDYQGERFMKIALELFEHLYY